MDFLINWLANIPGFSVPFALGAMGLILCEKSGVLNLGAEGYLLMGAMAGAGTLLTIGDYPLLAFLVAMGFAMACGPTSVVTDTAMRPSPISLLHCRRVRVSIWWRGLLAGCGLLRSTRCRSIGTSPMGM